MLRFRNDAIIIFSIICLQLPFELAYAHLYEIIGSDIIRFGLTAIYLFAIQYFTQIGGKVSVKLIKREKNESSEYRANSLIYKVRTKLHILFNSL
uniref:Anoctamin transmembrane domain-containing protein n=1 Tax=Helianthus annuus TaxID=4232 RepID=A0A251UUS9_HELAN